MIRLHLAKEHTHIEATLCARCPEGPAGCCAAPPGLAWSDVGRVVSLGGSAFLLAQIARGALRPGPRGLVMVRVDGPPREGGASAKRCVFHGPTGCTIAPEQRAATCNYYVCESALGDENSDARAACETLTAIYAAWDRAIGAEVALRFPDGPTWDAALLSWLGLRFEGEVSRSRRARWRSPSAAATVPSPPGYETPHPRR